MKTTKTKNNKAMKNVYILLAFSGLLVTALFGFDNHRSLIASQAAAPVYNSTVSDVPAPAVAAPKNTATEFDYTNLAPVTPAVADFSDVAPENPFTNLNPATPAEASFEELPADTQDQNVDGLSPVTPTEADFDDSYVIQPAGMSLQPVIPSEATFEEIN